MKRFFCTICGRVKRVIHLPLNTTNINHPNVMVRMGECDRHSDGRVHSHRVGLPPRVRPARPKQATPNKSAQRQNHKQSSKGVK